MIHPAPVRIPAPATDVWDVLADLDAWPDWSPSLTVSGGTVAPGERLLVDVGIPVLRLPARFVRTDRGVALDWRGGAAGLFVGHHAFELQSVDGGTIVDHWERFSGAGSAVLKPMAATLTAAYGALNAALHDRVVGLA